MATINPVPVPQSAQRTAADAQALHDDIRTRWSRLNDATIGALKDNDDLVTQVSGLYGLPRQAAQSDVDDLLKGRTL